MKRKKLQLLATVAEKHSGTIVDALTVKRVELRAQVNHAKWPEDDMPVERHFRERSVMLTPGTRVAGVRYYNKLRGREVFDYTHGGVWTRISGVEITRLFECCEPYEFVPLKSVQ